MAVGRNNPPHDQITAGLQLGQTNLNDLPICRRVDDRMLRCRQNDQPRIGVEKSNAAERNLDRLAESQPDLLGRLFENRRSRRLARLQASVCLDRFGRACQEDRAENRGGETDSNEQPHNGSGFASPGTSMRPMSHASRCEGASFLAISGNSVIPIGLRLRQSMICWSSSSRIYSGVKSS